MRSKYTRVLVLFAVAGIPGRVAVGQVPSTGNTTSGSAASKPEGQNSTEPEDDEPALCFAGIPPEYEIRRSREQVGTYQLWFAGTHVYDFDPVEQVTYPVDPLSLYTPHGAMTVQQLSERLDTLQRGAARVKRRGRGSIDPPLTRGQETLIEWLDQRHSAAERNASIILGVGQFFQAIAPGPSPRGMTASARPNRPGSGGSWRPFPRGNRYRRHHKAVVEEGLLLKPDHPYTEWTQSHGLLRRQGVTVHSSHDLEGMAVVVRWDPGLNTQVVPMTRAIADEIASVHPDMQMVKFHSLITPHQGMELTRYPEMRARPAIPQDLIYGLEDQVALYGEPWVWIATFKSR